MNEDWRNAFGILMCREKYDCAGVGICDGAPSTCSSYCYILCSFTRHGVSGPNTSRIRANPAEQLRDALYSCTIFHAM